jgi:hypothetical protein
MLPPIVVDPSTGRILPMSDAEQEARRDAAVRAIDAVSRITNETDTEELWREGMSDIDANRPNRKLFEGLY